jgi:asparagine synthase (glutamine-hydrolysing)
MKYGYINSPNSIYSKIYALAPASILVYKENKISISKYWEINFQEKLKISYPEALEQTYNLIDKTVNSMLTSERPTGIFLSGGYDSTLVAGFLTKNSATKINSFSIGFESSSYDESDSARQVAKYLGTNHHERLLKPDPNVFFSEIIAKLDQPFADSSYIPTYELARFASSSVVVAFGGDGGDEICAGYDRYLAATRFQGINSILPILKLPIRMLSKFTKLSKQKQFKLQNQLRRFPDIATRYESLVSLNLEKDLSSFFSSNTFINDYKIAHSIVNPLTSKADGLSKLLEIDFNNYLPGDLLVKADLATMSHGLELRSPLLNYELVEWMAKLPSDYKIHGFTTKRLLKDITHKFVPKNIMNRPKMGFAIPRADWLRNELRDFSYDLLTDQSARSRQWFNAKEINKVLNDHRNGIDRDQIIWPALCLEVWARNWL